MLWCLPHLQFPRKRRRAVPPPPPAKEEMRMHPQDTASESGIFYLVPNKHGPGKTIVRRPLPPPTSAPLDEDFDAYTQAGTTTRGPATDWEARNRGSDIAGSASPMDDDFDALTYTPAPRSSMMMPESSNRAQHRTRPQSSAPTGGSGRYDRAEPSEGFENYGEYGQYMNEMEKMFGGKDADLKLSVRQLNGQDQERSESRQIGRVSHGRVGPRGKGAIGRIGKPSKLGSVGRSMDVVGPRAGQAYEVVDHRVLEDGPERTVTISTWREQVANEAEAEVDVYYVGADEYAVESTAGDEAKTEPGSYTNRRRVTPPRLSQQPSGSSPGSSGGKTDPARGVRTSPERYTTPRKTSGQTYRSRSSELKNEDQVNRPGSSQSRNRTPPRMSTPERDPYRSPRATPVRGKNGAYGVEDSPPRSSTPIRRVASPLPMQAPSRGSTPNRTQAAAPSSFHPTQSGSTISTIKSASTIAFEQVLSSCEPPLLHISPLLSNLGISTEGHLRAVARLSEETRDREVREEALKQGVTVMEWAILLDKLQSL